MTAQLYRPLTGLNYVSTKTKKERRVEADDEPVDDLPKAAIESFLACGAIEKVEEPTK